MDDPTFMVSGFRVRRRIISVTKRRPHLLELGLSVGFGHINALDGVSLAFTDDLVFAGMRIELAALMLQIMHKFMHRQAARVTATVAAHSLIEVNYARVVIPADGFTLVAATCLGNKKRMRLVFKLGRAFRFRVTGKEHCPA